jgi:hypothetical protein
MKKDIKLWIFLAIVITFLSCPPISAQNICHMIYKEKVKPGNLDPTAMIKVPSKTQRTSNKKGEFVLTFDESVPDSIQNAIKVAKALWENKIPTVYDIKVTVSMESLDSDVCMLTDVSCYENDVVVPFSLYNQLYDDYHEMVTNEDIDIVIVLNSDVKWNCNYIDAQSIGYNVCTVGLRAFAIGLGFGSSVCQIYDADTDTDTFTFLNCYPSWFDNLIHQGDIYLSDLEPESEELKRFVTSDDLLVDGEVGSYELYAPSEYEPFQSLIYLKDSSSIMSYMIGEGDMVQNIDDATMDILKEMGWYKLYHRDSYDIQCGDIGEDGIGSAYVDHIFSIENGGDEDISQYEWHYYIKDDEDNYVECTTDKNDNSLRNTESEFTIKEIKGIDNYRGNINGDLEGKIECIYTINNKKYKSTPFTISLERKPRIISVDLTQERNSSNYTYSLCGKVEYAGADYLTIEIEEDYSSTVRSYRINEPFLAHIATGNISSLYYSWATIIVKNKYGSVYKTIEFAPNYTISTNSVDMITADSHVEIYTMGGYKVFEGSFGEYQKQNMRPGIYILKDRENGITTKVMKR